MIRMNNYIILDRKEQERLKRIESRIEYLEKKLAGIEIGYLVAELSALRWAVGVIKELERGEEDGVHVKVG